MSDSNRVLVSGATGYIGGRLRPLRTAEGCGAWPGSRRTSCREFHQASRWSAAVCWRRTPGLEHSPITLILGPRQCGKTTLGRQLGYNQEGSFYDLESPRDLARLTRPQTVLEAARGLTGADRLTGRR